jgi:hypothetical protein
MLFSSQALYLSISVTLRFDGARGDVGRHELGDAKRCVPVFIKAFDRKSGVELSTDLVFEPRIFI